MPLTAASCAGKRARVEAAAAAARKSCWTKVFREVDSDAAAGGGGSVPAARSLLE